MFKFIRCTTYLLVIIGALNWGLVGLFGFNLVSFLFGEMTTLTRIIYVLVGLSAILAPIFCYSVRSNCICTDD